MSLAYLTGYLSRVTPPSVIPAKYNFAKDLSSKIIVACLSFVKKIFLKIFIFEFGRMISKFLRLRRLSAESCLERSYLLYLF